MQTAKILVIDDEVKLTQIIKRSLEREGHTVLVANDSESAREIMRQPSALDIIFCDLRLPGDVDGIALLTEAKRYQPEADFIIITAYATVQTAVEALKKGAFDYLIKPVPLDELKLMVKRLLETRSLKEENVRLKEIIQEKFSFNNIVGVSKAIQAVLAKVAKVAPTNVSVLLRGESGTGKEIIAKTIHSASPRRDKPLIIVNCSAIPDTLLESELFGYVRGAFTGAYEDRKGLFQVADGGTIFLDEIGEISPALQVKLLRVLQDGEFQRLGDFAEKIKVDVRIIAATNKNLEEAVDAGHFRQDLYYRLNVVPIFIPPLRERKEDIPYLIEHFLKKYAPPGRSYSLSPEAMQLLMKYSWPGNIRELENAIEHAIVMAENSEIKVEDLPLAIRNFRQGTPSLTPGKVDVNHLTLEEMEKQAILNAIRRTQGNYSRAARLLGITRRTLGYRIKKYKLEESINKLRQEFGKYKGGEADENG